LRNARNTTFEKYITSLSPDDTSLWKATKGFKRPQAYIPPIRKTDGRWAKSDVEKATVLGTTFARFSRRTPLSTLTIL